MGSTGGEGLPYAFYRLLVKDCKENKCVRHKNNENSEQLYWSEKIKIIRKLMEGSVQEILNNGIMSQ